MACCKDAQNRCPQGWALFGRMHRDRPPQNIGVNLHQQRIVVWQTAGGDKAFYRYARLLHHVDNPAQSEGRGLKQRAIQVMRTVVQGQAREGAAQGAVHQRGATAVEPVDAAHSLGAGRKGMRLFG